MKRKAKMAMAAAVVLCPLALPSGPAPGETALSPIFGVGIPPDYRRWELVGVAHESGLDELRGIVGNASAIAAYQNGTLPFPDGSILVKLAWKHVKSVEFPPAFVPGAATTVQVMVKDSTKYSSTGGWGFGRFINGEPVDKAQHETCFGCHTAGVKDHDFVFTRLAP
jgi:hypothetical protein